MKRRKTPKSPLELALDAHLECLKKLVHAAYAQGEADGKEKAAESIRKVMAFLKKGDA